MSSIVDEVSRAREPAFGFLARSAARSLIVGLSAAAAWSAAAALTAFWPDRPESDWAYTSDFAVICGALAVALALAAFAGVRFAVLQRLQRLSPWLLLLALFLAACPGRLEDPQAFTWGKNAGVVSDEAGAAPEISKTQTKPSTPLSATCEPHRTSCSVVEGSMPRSVQTRFVSSATVIALSGSTQSDVPV